MAKRIDRFHNDFIDNNHPRNDTKEVTSPNNGDKNNSGGQNREQDEDESKERKNNEKNEKVQGKDEEKEVEDEDEDHDDDEKEEEVMEEEEEEEEEETREEEEEEEAMEDEEEDEDEETEEEDMEEKEEEEEELDEEDRGEVYEPLKKRQKKIGPDRISELPDSLILHILSSFGAKEVGRTSTLSKRWQFLWTSMPNLVFRHPNRQTTRFVQHVHKALLLRKPEYVKKLVLDFPYRAYNAFDVDAWIRFATESRVEELGLRLFCLSRDYKYYKLPPHVFSNTSFRNLELSFIKVLPSGSVSWTALKSLSLEFLNLRQETVEKILLGSPLLEILRLRNFSGTDYFKINSTSLKEFVMQNHFQCHALNSIVEISAPNLQSLHISGYFCGKHVRMMNVSSLVSADMDCRSIRWKGLIINYNLVTEYVNELFVSFRHITSLKLGSLFIEILSALAFKGLPFIFPSNLKVLTLESPMGLETFPGFFELLRSSPNLETLIIQRKFPHHPVGNSHDMELYRGEEDDWTPNWRTPNSFLQHLRIVKINSYMYPADPHDYMLIFVKFLLQNAKNLEKMVITAGKPLDCSSSQSSPALEEVSDKLSGLPKSSPSAVILFLP